MKRPLESSPCKSFTYSGSNMIVLGEIIKNASGMEIDPSSQNIFSHLLELTPRTDLFGTQME
ncbi:MAG: hypothetical protein ACFB2Y_06070 [Fulvivirga sp.]